MADTKIMDAKGIVRSMERIAYEIIENNHGAEEMAMFNKAGLAAASEKRR